MRKRALFISVWVGLLCAGGALAVEEASSWTPQKYFLGWETEPAMEYGGRDIESLHVGSCALGNALLNEPALDLFYEIPAAVVWSTFNHEFNGHGARAREFNMRPSYGVSLDLSAYTSADRPPSDLRDFAAFVAGGTEANGVLAHTMMLDALSADETDASRLPLLVMAKIDFGMYVLLISDPTAQPDPEAETSFAEEYNSGYDPACYLAARQGRRRDLQTGRNESLGQLWEQEQGYAADHNDPLLKENYDAMCDAAVWTLLDPSMLAAIYTYGLEHGMNEKPRVRPFMLRAGDRFAFSVGTRAYMEPDDVTRYLDLYVKTPVGLIDLYVRDLDASTDRTTGYGAMLHHVELGPNLAVSLQGDAWETPESAERFYSPGSAYNVAGEVELAFSPDFGVTGKAGYKSDGYLAGTPVDPGAYLGLGATFQF